MLLVDRAIGSAELLKPLQRMGLPAVDWHMPSADIAFEGRGEGGKPVQIGIEFKKIGELVGALRTGRLQGHQLLKMQQTYDFSWLLIEGEILFGAKGQLLQRVGRRDVRPMSGSMGVSELFKRIFVLCLAGGLMPIWSANRPTTLRWLEALYRTWTDTDLDKHKSHIVIYKPPSLIPISTFRTVVSGLPDIGLHTSKRAEEHFGTLYAAFTSDVEGWIGIEGIGRPTAEKLVDLIREGE